MRIILLLFILISILGMIYFPFNINDLVIIEWIDYHLEISPLFAISAFIIIFIITYIITYFFIFLKNIPKSLHKYYQEKQNHDDLILMLEASFALSHKDPSRIKNILKKIIAAQNHPQMLSIKPQALLCITHLYEFLNDIDELYEEPLEESYQSLLTQKETRFIGLKGLTSSRLDSKRYHEALTYAEKAFNLDSKDGDIIRSLIDIYSNLEEYEKAEKLIKKYKDSALLIKNYIAHANYLITQSDVDNAISLLEKAIKIDPANYEAVTNLARLYTQDDNKKSAYKIIEKAWKKDPSVDLAKFMINIFYDYNLDKKVQLLEKLINLSPKVKDGYLALAELYIEENMIPQARKIMDNLLALYPPDFYMSKIMSLIETKDQNNHSVILNWLNKL